MQLPGWAVVTIVVACFALYLLIFWRAEKRRGRDMADLARRLDMEFVGHLELDGLDTERGSRLFRRKGYIENAMTTKRTQISTVLFDYSYFRGRDSITQTAAAFDTGAPQFELRPARFWHSVARHLGYQKISFPSHPLFNRRYLVRGAYELEAASAFPASVLDYFEHLSHEWDWCVESNGSWLIVYRDNKPLKFRLKRWTLENTFSQPRIPVQELPEFLGQATEIALNFAPMQHRSGRVDLPTATSSPQTSI